MLHRNHILISDHFRDVTKMVRGRLHRYRRWRGSFLRSTSARPMNPGGIAPLGQDFGVTAEEVADGGVKAADEGAGFLDEGGGSALLSSESASFIQSRVVLPPKRGFDFSRSFRKHHFGWKYPDTTPHRLPDTASHGHRFLPTRRRPASSLHRP